MDVNRTIDINCDMGEGFAQDEQLFPLISSCNIACGGHAGDQESMKRTVELALKNDVQIGAHPSYPDKENFGRKQLKISAQELFESLGEQYLDLTEVARKEGAFLSYLKPHGALYNVLCQERELSEHYFSFLKKLDQRKILGLPNTSLQELSSTTNITYIAEGFADRSYAAEGQLVSRSEANALITNADKASKQVRSMILEKRIKCVDGQLIPMKVQTICIHSDTTTATAIASAVNKMFQSENIERRHF